jgi:hypothetical protein
MKLFIHTYIHTTVHDVFLIFAPYGDSGAQRVCTVSANGWMCVVLGENGVFQICYPFV